MQIQLHMPQDEVAALKLTGIAQLWKMYQRHAKPVSVQQECIAPVPMQDPVRDISIAVETLSVNPSAPSRGQSSSGELNLRDTAASGRGRLSELQELEALRMIIV